jgi:hypothetical protein
MFNYFKNRKTEREAKQEKARVFNKVIAQVGSGNGSLLEAALVLQLTEGNQESLSRLLMAFGGADIWILNKGEVRVADPAVTEGSDGAPYVAAFTSEDRASTAKKDWGMPNHVTQVSALELVFTLNAVAGIVLNANEEHFQWSFTPQHVANLRILFEGSHNYEVGGVYSVWTQGGYRAIKLLSSDDGGLHLRLYGNSWVERPTHVDPKQLTLESTVENSPRAIGHMPLVRASFLAMGPRLLVKTVVEDSELDGYRMWEEAKGGYFGGYAAS